LTTHVALRPLAPQSVDKHVRLVYVTVTHIITALSTTLSDGQVVTAHVSTVRDDGNLRNFGGEKNLSKSGQLLKQRRLSTKQRVGKAKPASKA